jgi:GT2 family glycosyltransferase
LLPSCLEALAAQDYRPFETIVVDNGSIDGSVDLLAGRHDLALIRNPTNLGFAVANNQALRVALGEFVLLLNYDAILGPGYVSALVACLRADPHRGSATGKLIRPSPGADSPTLDSTGHVMYRNDWAMNRGEDEPDRSQYCATEEVFGVCAAAGLYRRSMLDDVMVDGEVLDSTFFAYLEDVDLDWRARLRGWQSWYEPAAVATHHRSATGGRFSTRIQRHIFKNRLLMIIKNDSGRSFLARLPGIVAFTGAKLVLGTLQAPTFLTALWDVARLSPVAWRKRRQVQARRTVAPSAIERWLQPYPYLRKLRQARRSPNRWISQS